MPMRTRHPKGLPRRSSLQRVLTGTGTSVSTSLIGTMSAMPVTYVRAGSSLPGRRSAMRARFVTGIPRCWPVPKGHRHLFRSPRCSGIACGPSDRFRGGWTMSEGEGARKTDEFAERLLRVINDGMLTLMISVGDRTGLFDVMESLPPSGSVDIAKGAALDERYVREWLAAMSTGG